MSDSPVMMVSLKDAKRVSKALSNETAVKILEFLSEREASESEIAKSLGIPLSTAHYNIRQLVEAKLVVAEEFHYSEKGKEVNHYKLANKHIVISPKPDDSFLKQLQKYLPAGLIVAGTAVVLKAMQYFTAAAEPRAMRAMESADTMIADMTAETAMQVPWWLSPVIDYAIIGAAAVIVILIAVEAVRYWRSQ